MRKKFLLSKFLVLLILITGSVGVASAQIAKIGDDTYSTFADALTAANNMTGDVTVEIYGAGEFIDGMELNGSYTSINFIGNNDEAKLTVNQTAGGDYLGAHGKTVSFTDLILAKANPAWANNSGHMGNYFSIQGGTVTYTNCTFPNGACTSGATATYTDCTFQNSSEYGLWVYDDALVTVNGGTIDSKKGIKVYSEGEESVTSTLTVQNATFTANVTAKPAVAVGYAQSITLIGNTYNNLTAHVELDSGSDADCEGITFVAEDAEGNDIASTLEMTDRSNSNAPCGVLCDGKIYTTVAQAAADATAGSTVTLLYASTETVELPAGVILDTNGYTADGVTEAAPDLTISTAQELINFAKDVNENANKYEGKVVALGANINLNGNETNLWTPIGKNGDSNPKFKGTFDGKGYTISNLYVKQEAAYHAAGLFGATNGTIKNFTIDGAYVESLSSGNANGATVNGTAVVAGSTAYGATIENVHVKNATVKGNRYVAGIVGYMDGVVKGCSVENVTIVATPDKLSGSYDNGDKVGGIVGYTNSNATEIASCELKGTISIKGYRDIGGIVGTVQSSVVVSDNTNSATVSITVDQNTGYYGDKDANAGEFIGRGTANSASTDNTTAEGATYTVETIPYTPVASVNGTNYTDIQEAIKAAAPSGTVEILSDVTVDKWIMFSETLTIGSGQIITMDINGLTINGNDHSLTIKSIESASNGNRLFYDATNLNIKDLTINCTDAAANQGGIGLTSGTIENVTFNGGAGVFPGTDAITIKGCTFKTNVHSIYYEEARDNLVVQGNTFELADNANVILLRGNTKFIGNTVISGRTVNVVSGSPVVSGNDFNEVRFKVYNAATATISENEINNLAFDDDETPVCSAFTENILNEVAQNALNAITVAQIGTTKYGSLQAAINAAVNGDVVTLLTDNAENVTVTQKPDVKFTIDGADKTMTGTITIDGKTAAYATAGITVKNMNFTAATEAVCINLGVSGNNNTRYTNNVTVESCNFTGTDKTAVGIKSYTGGDKNLIVNDCTVTGMHSLMQLKNTAGVSVTECVITDSKNGISLGASSGVAINETTVNCDGYGVRADANGNNGNATITDCTIEAFIPVVIRKASNNYGLQFDGENTMTATNADGLWCAIGTSEYETNGTMPTVPTGDVTVTLNDTGLSMDGVYGEHFALNGEGTAESPYLINNLYELKGFRDDVNKGVTTKYNAPGVWVALGDDIDMTDVNWTPSIGLATTGHGFMGNFDGKNFKIKNLTITNPALDSDGYAYAGFFGVTEGTDKDNQNTIKNLTIENVTISTTGQIAAAAVAYPYYTIIDNVKVCGDIKIQGGNYTAGVLAYTRRCVNASNLSIVGNDGSFVKGNQTVGGVISDIQMNGGLTAVYNNFSAEGLTISGTKQVGGISGIIAAQTLNTCSVMNVTLECSDNRVGIVSGSLGGASTITDVFTENVTGATVIIGAGYDGGKAVEAKIGDTYYATLQAALNAVVEGTSNVTVELISDIDLTDVNWTPVGTETKPFIGNFNGNEHTIKKLNIVETEAVEGKAYVGLFGYAKNATIKNVTFENVNLNIACLDIDHSQGHIGAVAGSLEGNSTIENVTVKGDVKVEATFDANGASRVAVVAGGNSYGNVTMKNVHVIANEGSYLKANNNVGALAGQLQGKSVFENCSSNIDVTGMKFFAGGIIGLAAGDQTFTNCHTTGDVKITAGREGRANDQYRVGGIAGGWADGKTKVCTLTDCTYTGNVSGTNADGSVANPLDYAGYVGRGYTLANCAGSKVVIDGVEYVQVYDTIYGIYEVNGNIEINTAVALKTVAETPSADSVSVVLGDDITLTETIKINAVQTRTATDNVVTIDLNGNTITGTDNNDTGSFALIEIQPGAELIIEDSSEHSTGKITLTATNNREWNAYSSVISNQRGKLTIEAGTLEHNGGTDMAYGIDNLTNGKGTYAETIINGGTVKSTYRAIRQFLNGVEAQNILTVNGGTIEGANKSIWMQDPSVNANTGTLTVGEEANLIGDVYLYVTPNSTSWPVEVSIAAGALAEGSEIITGNVPAGYELKLVDGVYGVCSVEAKIGEVTYATLAAAVNAANEGDTITLVTDITFTEATRTLNSGSWYDGLYYIGDKSFTIDLNSYTIGHDNSVNDYLLNFKNDGAKANVINLINGTIEAGSTAYCALATSSSNTNKITINTENINIINNNSNGSTIKVRGGVELNVNAGTVITGKDSYLGIECVASTVNIYDGAEIYMNGSTSYNGCLVGACANGTVNVYGGYGEGVKGGFIAMTSGGTINVAGGEWIANTDGTVGGNSNLYVLTAQNNKNESGYAGASIINVTGGTFRGGMDAWILNDVNVEKAELNISGGNFNADPTSYVDLNNYKVVNEDDGTYTVEVDGFEKFYTAAGVETTSDDAAYSLSFTVTDYANNEVSVKIGSKNPNENKGCDLLIPSSVKFNDQDFAVTSIPVDGFNACKGFDKLVVPGTITSVSSSAFYNCSKLTEVVIEEGVQKLGSNTFYKISNLQTLTLPSTLTRIESLCFNGTHSIETIVCNAQTPPTAFTGSFTEAVYKNALLYVDGKYEDYKAANGWSNFKNILAVGATQTIDKDRYTLIATITDVWNRTCSVQIGTAPTNTKRAELAIPEHVSFSGIEFDITSIPEGGFQDCKYFEGTLTIPAYITSIGKNAFEGCSGVTALVVEEGVTSLGTSDTFNGCRNIETITLPSTLTKIPTRCFHNILQKLQVVECHALVPPTLASQFTQEAYNSATLYVHDVDAYKGANNWKSFKSIRLIGAVAQNKETEVEYKSIAEAVAAANAGETVQMLQNVDLENTITVAAGKEVVLDLNGKTVSYTTTEHKGEAMITNNGNLTITDTSDEETGSLSYAYEGGADSSYGFGNSTIENKGVLTINAGTVENTSAAMSHASYAINTGAGATLNVEGGNILNLNGHAVRMVSFGTELNTVNINGGYIEGTRALQVQLPGSASSTTKPAMDLNITGGELMSNEETYNLAIYVFSNGQSAENVSVEISGGTFNGNVAVNAAATNSMLANAVAITDGTFNGEWGVFSYADDEVAVPVISITGGTFATNYSEFYAADEQYVFEQNENGTYSVVEQTIFTQTRELAQGWNWFSYYVNTDLTALETALGENGVQITSKTDGFVAYNSQYGWSGNLSSITESQMYMINVGASHDLELSGELVGPTSITLHQGWNWIGFPMSEAVSVTDALAGFEAKSGDQIKSKDNGFASYNSQYGWGGTLSTLNPGEGYMYQSNNSETTELFYSAGTRGELKANVTTDGNHWIPNAGQYPNNMTMTAMVEVEGGDYEVAAFVNGECRGSARPIYIEALDAHILFLTIHGEDVEEMTFRYYDIATGEDFELNDRINYSNDAIVGTLAEPYIFSRGTTGIGEVSLSEVNIYPNPTTTGTEINLQATCDTVEVFNALGVKVAEYHNVDSIDAFETAGIYVIRITDNGDVKHCRLIVK